MSWLIRENTFGTKTSSSITDGKSISIKNERLYDTFQNITVSYLSTQFTLQVTYKDKYDQEKTISKDYKTATELHFALRAIQREHSELEEPITKLYEHIKDLRLARDRCAKAYRHSFNKKSLKNMSYPQ